MDRSREPAEPEITPVEQLAIYFNDLMRMAEMMQQLDSDARSPRIHTAPLDPELTRITFPDGIYHSSESRAAFTDQPYEHVYMREADRVHRSMYGFTRVESSSEPAMWTGAGFHIIRPLVISEPDEQQISLLDEAFDGDDEEALKVIVERPDRFVLFIDMPDDKADQCYIVHKTLAGDYKFDAYDLELLDAVGDDVSQAVDALIAELHGGAVDDGIEPDDGIEFADHTFAERPGMEAYVLSILDHLQTRATLHPFDTAA